MTVTTVRLQLSGVGEVGWMMALNMHSRAFAGCVLDHFGRDAFGVWCFSPLELGNRRGELVVGKRWNGVLCVVRRLWCGTGEGLVEVGEDVGNVGSLCTLVALYVSHVRDECAFASRLDLCNRLEPTECGQDGRNVVASRQAFLSTELSTDRFADPCSLIVVGMWICFPLLYELLESARLCFVVCGRLRRRRRCRVCGRSAVVELGQNRE